MNRFVAIGATTTWVEIMKQIGTIETAWTASRGCKGPVDSDMPGEGSLDMPRDADEDSMRALHLCGPEACLKAGTRQDAAPWREVNRPDGRQCGMADVLRWVVANDRWWHGGGRLQGRSGDSEVLQAIQAGALASSLAWEPRR
jgi:hypothetical protein